MEYKEYLIQFLDIPDDEGYLNYCLSSATISDGVILIYDLSKNLPQTNLINIVKGVEARREGKELKPITFFVLLNKKDLLENEDRIRHPDKNFLELYGKSKQFAYLGAFSVKMDEQKHIEQIIIEKIINVVIDKKKEKEEEMLQMKKAKKKGFFSFYSKAYSGKEYD